MEENKKLSSNRAITLVSLIITIIVMLILVGVSVQVIINSNLLEVAQNAVNRTEASYANESDIKVEIGNKTYNSIEEYMNNMRS